MVATNQLNIETSGIQTYNATTGVFTASTPTQHAVQVGAANNLLTSLSVGATNTVLLGNTGADPSFGAVPNAALSNSSVTLSNGTNISITGSPLSLGGTATINVSGPITPTSYTAHGVIIGAGSSALTVTAAGSVGQVLQSGGASADPTYSTATYPSTATGTGTILRADGTNWSATTTTYPNTNAINTILYASSANIMSALATANNGILITSASGVPSILADGTTGQILTATTGSPPSWVNPATGTILTKFTSNGTFTKNAATKWIEVIAWGGGAGGGAGRRGATSTARFGGGGGGAGQVIFGSFDSAVFSGSGETVTIGGAANGGGVQTVDSNNGADGTVGNNTSIGSIIISRGGSLGHGGSAVSGTGGTPAGGSGMAMYNKGAITLPSSVNTNVGQGGNSLGASAAGDSSNGILWMAGTGGGGGGALDASNNARNGGNGGSIVNSDNSTVIITGGTAGTSGASGGAGNAGVQASQYFILGGTGGGGGGAVVSGSVGSGNNGAAPGGGGGGGAASLNGNNSGAGGNGARGELWVIEYL